MSNPNPPSCGRWRATPQGAWPLPRPPRGRGSPVRASGPPPLVNRATRPPDRGSFAAVARAAAPLSSSSAEGLVHLAKAFPELSTSRLQDMQKRSGTAKPKGPPTVHGLSRWQVILWAKPFQADTDSDQLLDQVHSYLTLHHSKLVVHSVLIEPPNGFVLSTDVPASDSDLLLIHQAAKLVWPTAEHVDAALLFEVGSEMTVKTGVD
jgi:hypothetical protein